MMTARKTTGENLFNGKANENCDFVVADYTL